LTTRSLKEKAIIFFFYGKGNENCQMGTGFSMRHRREVKRVDLVSDRISYTDYTDLRGRWFNIFVSNVHTWSEEKSGYSKY